MRDPCRRTCWGAGCAAGCWCCGAAALHGHGLASKRSTSTGLGVVQGPLDGTIVFFFFLAWGVRLGRLTHPRDGSLQGLEVGRSGWTNRCFAEGVLNETAGCRSVSCSLSMLHALIPTELVSMACLLRNCSLEGPVVDCGVTCCATVYGSEPEQGCLLVQYPVSSPFTEQHRRDVAVGWWCSPPPRSRRIAVHDFHTSGQPRRRARTTHVDGNAGAWRQGVVRVSAVRLDGRVLWFGRGFAVSRQVGQPDLDCWRWFCARLVARFEN